MSCELKYGYGSKTLAQAPTSVRKLVCAAKEFIEEHNFSCGPFILICQGRIIYHLKQDIRVTDIPNIETREFQNKTIIIGHDGDFLCTRCSERGTRRCGTICYDKYILCKSHQEEVWKDMVKNLRSKL